MSLSLAVQFASKAKHLPSRAQVRRWAHAAHSRLPTNISGVVTIIYVEEMMAREMNRQFRGKDYATNVLTFAFKSLSAESRFGKASSKRGGEEEYVSDIVICAPVIAREAREQKKPVAAHHGHMVLHGMLHAQGFDHEDAVEAEAMEAIEISLLRRFRIDNPYESV
ncbi:MAG TPA: rRNA maturation RNase YbeY [Casimicrobium sp.]|nr:rRNA maturation RNase YbeY [Casimicrobium sp.]HPT57838.1 rRNA maturation RNase YbeY [Casimicrobium sp.]